MKLLKKPVHYWEVIWVLAKAEVKTRYQGSLLGMVWVLLKPLALFAILHVVFSGLFSGQVEWFTVKLLLSLLLWNFFAEGTMQGMHSIINKGHILKKIPLEPWVMVLSATVHSALIFLCNTVVFAGLFWLYGVPFSLLQAVGALYMVALLYGIVVVIAMVGAIVLPKLRDLGQAWEVVLQLLFYGAPIIYPLSIIPDAWHWLVYLNPMGFVVEHAKSIIVDGHWGRLDHHGLAVALVVLSLTILWMGRKGWWRQSIQYL